MSPKRRADSALDGGDDMRDPPEWIDSPALGPALRLCEEVLGQPFRDADEKALKSQRRHRRHTNAAALCGLAAVTFALYQFVFHGARAESQVWAVAAVVAMVLALGAVALGARAAWHHQWLFDRHRAELIRGLKFEFMIEPGHWTAESGQLEEARAWLKEHLHRIQSLNRRDVKSWSQREQAPEPPPAPSSATYPALLLADLVRYYVDRRLHFQRGYFTTRRRARGVLDRLMWDKSKWLFVIAGAAVFLHFGLALTESKLAVGPHLRIALQFEARWLLYLAVFIPALNSTFRTWRLANESGRNRVRARAKEVALRGMISALSSVHSREGVVKNLWSCEQVLESDHREWLRLMTEAEWFG